MRLPSIHTLTENLDIDIEKAKRIRAIMSDASLSPDDRLAAIDLLIGTHGVEYISAGHNKKSPAIAYCNAGDPYYSTVLYVSWLLIVLFFSRCVNDAALKDGACNESSNASID